MVSIARIAGERGFPGRFGGSGRPGGIVWAPGGPFEGGTLLLLHTIGAKSGQPRLSPLAYLDIDGKILIVGSYAGGPKDPAWVHNLRANPRARVEVGVEAYAVTARELPDDERDAAYPKIIELVRA
ncbi:nitroreductase family deazaflavin-dependent oxidoreductase [Mycobacterium sp. TNTM28]|uniref:Nitroreductase family deazaflavin-dependent oxidoreductase n=1 Tax=[Mycobacterium] fortunisiensis TaxID=2600579 RepID=A0ABS6KMM5_9MYCO|nr:nitroreductase family deazaflavin-dependent oxidoreductase [[Mycobacterium] fortunisiensis]